MKPPPSPQAGKAITPSELDEMRTRSSAMARDALKWLSFVAGKDPSKGEDLLALAWRACEAVEEWRTQFPESAAKIAKQRAAWPCLYGRHIAIRESTKDSLEGLGLGEMHPLSNVVGRRGKTMDLRVPANAWAAMAIEAMHESRRTFSRDSAAFPNQLPKWRVAAQQLPALSSKTSRQWSDVAIEGCDESRLLPLMVDKDGKSLGYYRRDHTLGHGVGGIVSQAIEANIRDGTRARFRKAFLEMAGGPTARRNDSPK